MALPAAIGIAAVADLVVPVVLGEKWVHIIPLVHLLALYGGIGCLLTNVGPLFNAMGRPYWMTYLQVLSLSILLPSAWYLCTTIGVMGAAWSFLMTTAVTSPLTLVVVCRLLDMRFSALLGIVWRPGLSVLVMYYTVRLFVEQATEANVATLLAAIGIGMFAYAAVISGSWYLAGRPTGAERSIFRQARRWIAASRLRAS
ncbi:MAG: hypothetical protein DHS20C16_37680 [Phycisphaerae bacterium]|nr:MAG: hypothetical protein DHS20C16_37680 [Phycisphaerae bacterium]